MRKSRKRQFFLGCEFAHVPRSGWTKRLAKVRPSQPCLCTEIRRCQVLAGGFRLRTPGAMARPRRTRIRRVFPKSPLWVGWAAGQTWERHIFRKLVGKHQQRPLVRINNDITSPYFPTQISTKTCTRSPQTNRHNGFHRSR